MSASSFRFEAIGTQWAIDLSHDLSPDELTHVERAVIGRIEQYDKTYSRFREDSLITRISQQAGQFDLPEDSVALLSLYKRLHDLTQGKFTPLIGQVMEDTGYDAEYLWVL